MILRVRSQLGVWRIECDNAWTVRQLKEHLAAQKHLEVDTIVHTPLSLDGKGQRVFPDDARVGTLGLNHGDMVFLLFDEESRNTMVHEESKTQRVIENGRIVARSYDQASEKQGFRPGMMPLSSIKRHWTLTEFMDLDARFNFTLKRQEEAWCKGVSLDTASVNSFQTYMRRLDFQRERVGHLYGSFTDEGKVRVEAIYEPPQIADESSFDLPDDPLEERVEALAKLMHLQRVGWIIAHPPREDGFLFSGNEIITAAEFQLEAANGVEQTNFVTVKLTLNEDGNTQVDAYQVSRLAMEMVAEGALEVSPNLGMLKVNPTFTVVQEGKPASEVEPAFFLCPVPIEQHESSLVSFFPKANRDDEAQTRDAVKAQLAKATTGRGWTLEDVMADFNLLLFLTDFFPVHQDMPIMTQAVIDKEFPLPEGHKVMLNALGLMD